MPVSLKIELVIECPAAMSSDQKADLRKIADHRILPVCKFFQLHWSHGDSDRYANEADERQKIYISEFLYIIEGNATDARVHRSLANIVVSVFELVSYDERFRTCSFSNRIVGDHN